MGLIAPQPTPVVLGMCASVSTYSPGALSCSRAILVKIQTPYKNHFPRPHKNTELWMLFGSRHRAAHCPWSLRASVLYVSFPALLLSGRLVFFIFSMVLMQDFILEVFLTSLNGRGLEFPIHLNFNKA